MPRCAMPMLPGPHCRIVTPKDQCCPSVECDELGKECVKADNHMPYPLTLADYRNV